MRSMLDKINVTKALLTDTVVEIDLEAPVRSHSRKSSNRDIVSRVSRREKSQASDPSPIVQNKR